MPIFFVVSACVSGVVVGFYSKLTGYLIFCSTGKT